MPVLIAISQHTLRVVDISLAVAGGIMLLFIAAAWWRAGQPNPLWGSPIRLNRLTPLWLWLCVLAQLTSWMIAGVLIPKTTGTDKAGQADAPNQTQVAEDQSGLPDAKGPLRSDQASHTAPDPQRSVLVANLGQALMVFVTLAIANLTFVNRLKGLGIGRQPLGSDMTWAVTGWLASIPICSCVYWLTVALWRLLQPNFSPPDHAVLTTIKDPGVSIVVRMLAIVGAFLLAPVSEELLFRGILQTGIKKLGFVRWGSWQHRWLAIAVTATIFGTMHLNTPHHVPALIAFGAILGFLYERTGSIMVPIFVHMIFNGKTLLWVALAQ